MSLEGITDFVYENITGLPGNVTTPLPDPKVPMHFGYIAVFVSVIFFGSNFLPVKKFKTGDGIFFQWVLCVGIWVVGLVVNAIRNFPAFQPLAMIGGLLWCTGNMMVVPIITFVGLAKGILIWGSFNLMMGWASSRFGWFGINPQNPSSPIMNYVGVALCLTSACIYLFMRTSGSNETEDKPIDDNNEEKVPSLDDEVDVEMLSKKSRKKELLRKIGGTAMAVCAGCFFGLTFAPVVYKKDKDPEASPNGLDYVFSHFTGILITSTVYFLTYCAIKKNQPAIYPNVVLPGFVSGVMWGIACVAWFVANDALSESISFPIVTTLPGIIGTLWGLLFREIKGLKNYLVLLVAISIGVAGSITTGFSK